MCSEEVDDINNEETTEIAVNEVIGATTEK